jgi:precorrin-2 dehydrogenase/sirohydrochlorin ferrochelatase
MARYYPMMMDLQGRRCVVVGGGEVAARKVETLLECGAEVAVIALKISKSLDALAKDGKISVVSAGYATGGLHGAALAIAATDDENVNRAVFNDAKEAGIPVNVVDVPDLCTFIVPSIVERGDLLIAISTSGKSPATSKKIRMEIERQFGWEYARLLELMGEIRTMIQERVPELEKRMRVLTEIANSDLLDKLKAGEKPSAGEILQKALSK